MEIKTHSSCSGHLGVAHVNTGLVLGMEFGGVVLCYAVNTSGHFLPSWNFVHLEALPWKQDSSVRIVKI